MIKECTKEVMHNAVAHHVVNDAQPGPEQQPLYP